MKKYWKIISIGALIAGILYYPALKLYLYLTKAKTKVSEDLKTGTNVKTLFPRYRGKYKLHYPHSHDGDANANLA